MIDLDKYLAIDEDLWYDILRGRKKVGVKEAKEAKETEKAEKAKEVEKTEETEKER